MPGAIFPTFALKRSRYASQKRYEVAARNAQHKRFIKEVLSSWDEGRSGNLTYAEVSKWLSAVNQGNPVSDDEIKWVIVMANKGKIEDYEAAAIEPEALPRALQAFMSYKECQSDIDKVFEQYDSDKSGGLDQEQLTNVLTALNGGQAPTEEEVAFVLMHADVIGNGVVTRPELSKAISVWYVHVDQKKQEAVNASGMCSAGPCAVQ